MASRTDIANLALLRIGVSQQLTNVDTDQSREALSAKLIFDDERLYVLRDYPWAFARKYAALTYLDGSAIAPVNLDWIFSYAYPADCVFARRIVTCYGRQDPSPPPFVVGRDDSGETVQRLIFTNQEDAELEYTVNVTDVAEFDGLFTSMLAWRLAASLALSLSRLPDIAKTCLEMYTAERSQAITRASAEGEYAVSSGQADPRCRDILVLALTRIGISRNTVASEADMTLAALWPRINYADERDFILREFPWAFATAYAVPTLATGTPTVPANADWVYAYIQPADCLFVRRIVTPSGRQETQPPPFRIGSGITNPLADVGDRVRGRLIFTNLPLDADHGTSIEYTLKITDPAELDAAFTSMLAWRIAATLAPSFANVKKDPRLVERCFQNYEIEKDRAKRMSLSEQQTDEPLAAEWIRGR